MISSVFGRRLLSAFAAVTLMSCGNLYNFDSGGGGAKAQIFGTIQLVNVDSQLRDFVIFVYTDLCETNKSDPAICNNLLLPDDLPLITNKEYSGIRKLRVRADGDREFRVKKIKKGNLTVAVLQDSATDPDQTIDPEDVTITRDGGGNIVPNATNAVAVFGPNPQFDDIRRNARIDFGDTDLDFPTAVATAEFPESTSSTTNTTITTSTTSTTVVE